MEDINDILESSVLPERSDPMFFRECYKPNDKTCRLKYINDYLFRIGSINNQLHKTNNHILNYPNEMDIDFVESILEVKWPHYK